MDWGVYAGAGYLLYPRVGYGCGNAYRYHHIPFPAPAQVNGNSDRLEAAY